jgi:hypothetical protein
MSDEVDTNIAKENSNDGNTNGLGVDLLMLEFNFIVDQDKPIYFLNWITALS